MPDREKVIKGLEWCMNEKHDCYREKGCPYENEGEDIGCKYALHRDALALLKAQEPRVMTLEEVKSLKQDAVVWYEHTGINGPRPRIVHYADDRCIVFTDGGKWQYDADGYGNLWRCWTSRPTDAQREAIPWE